MQLSAKVRYGLRGFSDAFLLPAIGDRAQQRKQGGGRRDQDALRHRILQKRGIGFQGGAVQMLTR